MTDGNIVAFGFPPEVTPSEALHEVARAFHNQCDEIMTPAENLIFAATLHDLAYRVSGMELALGLFGGGVIYEAANESAPPAYGQPGLGGSA